MRSLSWTLATVVGFVAGGSALHSPGAVTLGPDPFEWDVVAAVTGAAFGAVVGAFTGYLQTRAVGASGARFVIASLVAVAVAHALADGAPATWGVSYAGALSGAPAALAFAWADRSLLDWRAVGLWSLAWWGGWVGGVGLLGATVPGAGYDHEIIGGFLGLLWGSATSPAVRGKLGAWRHPHTDRAWPVATTAPRA